MALLITAVVGLCLGLLGSVNGQMPLPRREVGFVYGSGQPNASVHLDVYIDLTCPDSKAVWPTVLQVASHYGPDILQLTTHLFPLPYHRFAFYAAKGAHVVDSLSNGKSTYDWFNSTFNILNTLSNSATYTSSDAVVVQRLVNLADHLLPGQQQQFQYMMLNSLSMEMDTRVAWKYACTRGVANTPTFMVNDVVVAADNVWTLADWRNLIDPLLQI